MGKFNVTVYYTYCVTFDNIEADSYEDAANKAYDMGAKCNREDLDFVDYQNCEVAKLDNEGNPIEYATIQ